MIKVLSRKGFTLIELMIVVAIIAVIAAIAIPSLMQSRMAANETKCIGALKAYGGAQAIYRRRKGKFANDFALLHTDGTTVLKLLDMSIIKATSATAPPYSGYYFGEMSTTVNFSFEYNLAGTPTKYESSGVLTFFTDQQGTIFQKDQTSSSIPTAVPDPAVDTTWKTTGG